MHFDLIIAKNTLISHYYESINHLAVLKLDLKLVGHRYSQINCHEIVVHLLKIVCYMYLDFIAKGYSIYLGVAGMESERWILKNGEISGYQFGPLNHIEPQ